MEISVWKINKDTSCLKFKNLLDFAYPQSIRNNSHEEQSCYCSRCGFSDAADGM